MQAALQLLCLKMITAKGASSDELIDEMTDTIISMDYAEATAACKEEGLVLPDNADLDALQDALLVHFECVQTSGCDNCNYFQVIYYHLQRTLL